jgi:hypothetical protein
MTKKLRFFSSMPLRMSAGMRESMAFLGIVAGELRGFDLKVRGVGLLSVA